VPPPGFRPRTVQPTASRYTGPLLVSQWDSNYGIAEAPSSYLRLSKSLWTASQNNLRHLQTAHACRHIRQTKPPKPNNPVYRNITAFVPTSYVQGLHYSGYKTSFPKHRKHRILSPTPRGTLTQNITTDFEDYKNCGATSILGETEANKVHCRTLNEAASPKQLLKSIGK
jgi:hypothetical protein